MGAAITAMGRQFSGHAVDFSDRSALTDFAARLEADGTVPDILVNNAGTIKGTPQPNIRPTGGTRFWRSTCRRSSC